MTTALWPARPMGILQLARCTWRVACTVHVAGMLRGGVQGEDKGCWKYDDYSVTSETGGPFGSTQYTFDHVFGVFALATVSAVLSSHNCKGEASSGQRLRVHWVMAGCRRGIKRGVSSVAPHSLRVETRTQEVYETMLRGIVTSVIAGFNGAPTVDGTVAWVRRAHAGHGQTCTYECACMDQGAVACGQGEAFG